MSPWIVFVVLAGYFIFLIAISFFTNRDANAASFFTANKQSPWYLVAYGMIGASLSGVTFISVPGEVGSSHFFYFQIVLGYLAGYWVIANILLPVYYRLNLVSIYQYLEQRYGFWSYQTGAGFFLLSRIIGASFRLFLVAGVLQLFFFDAIGVPFWVSVLITIALIWIYTFRGGIKTIVWTDTLQTTFMLLSVIVTIFLISRLMGGSLTDTIVRVMDSPHAQVFDWDWNSGTNFFKQFLAGAFIAIAMTGLDQDMMQKNLTCRSLQDAQKNIFWFSVILVIANIIFLFLGAVLYEYSEFLSIQTPSKTDQLFPTLALNHLGTVGGILFLLGITAAAYSSADSALTALTTSFSVDFLGFGPGKFEHKKTTRTLVHVVFSLLLFLVVIIFEWINDDSVINSLFRVAGYTYGPILGLYAFGLFTNLNVRDQWVPLICLCSPLLAYILQANSVDWFGGYRIGFEILLFNGAFTAIGLWIASFGQNNSLKQTNA